MISNISSAFLLLAVAAQLATSTNYVNFKSFAKCFVGPLEPNSYYIITGKLQPNAQRYTCSIIAKRPLEDVFVHADYRKAENISVVNSRSGTEPFDYTKELIYPNPYDDDTMSIDFYIKQPNVVKVMNIIYEGNPNSPQYYDYTNPNMPPLENMKMILCTGDIMTIHFNDFGGTKLTDCP